MNVNLAHVLNAQVAVFCIIAFLLFFAGHLLASQLAQRFEGARVNVPGRYVVGVGVLMLFLLAYAICIDRHNPPISHLEAWLGGAAIVASGGSAILLLWGSKHGGLPQEQWPGMAETRLTNWAQAILENMTSLILLVLDNLEEGVQLAELLATYQKLLRACPGDIDPDLPIRQLKRIAALRMGKETEK